MSLTFPFPHNQLSTNIPMDVPNALKNKNSISKKLLKIREKYPIDLIVYTKDEWAFLKSSVTSFIRAIEEKGIDLL